MSIEKARASLKANPTLIKIANSKIANKTKELLSKIPTDRIVEYIKLHKRKVISITIISIIVIFYFVVIYNRVERYLSKMDVYQINIQPIQYDKAIMTGDYRLCDFYVASSYKSYLPCTNYYDYASVEAIKRVLAKGARYIDLDVFNNDFEPCTTPVVCAGKEVGNWHYTTSITFYEAIEAIAKYGFGNNVTNPTDPLFININFKTWGNSLTVNKCAAIIKDLLSAKLLSNEYSYQGRFASINLCTVPIVKLLEKIIIITSGDISNTDMDELCNLNTTIGGNFRELTYEQVRDTYDANEITEFSRRNITRVIGTFKNRDKENYNFFTPYYLGCQFMCMNYTNPDDIMMAYIKRFSKSSLILKPLKLRYKPNLIAPPLAQTKIVSFATKQVVTPLYSISY